VFVLGGIGFHQAGSIFIHKVRNNIKIEASSRLWDEFFGFYEVLKYQRSAN